MANSRIRAPSLPVKGIRADGSRVIGDQVGVGCSRDRIAPFPAA